MDHREAADYWRAAYRAIIPVLEELLNDMRFLARSQPTLRRAELGVMDIAPVAEQLDHMIERLDYWDRMALVAAATDA
ncbi:MAG: hypothetical protein ABI838_05450 [Chloroflexota bacterium]